MIISHNLGAMFTSRALGITTNNRAKSAEKLSSGYKVNRAADDAAGLSISEKMRRQIRGLKQGAENMQDGISFCQTADGYLNEVVDMLHRMNELSIKAANGTNSASDRMDIDNEIQELKEETARIFSTAKFNETYIFRVPYVPAPVINGDDIQIFSNGLDATGKVKYGGLEINDVRHTWEELGINISADGMTFAGDQKISFNDYTGELFELYVKGGDPLSQIMRRNYWDAKDDGVYINEVKAQTWDEIGIKNVNNRGEYKVTFKNQDIFFEVNDGDTKEQVIENISGKLLNSKYSWDIMTSGHEDAEKKAVDITLNQRINITENNKSIIDSSISYGISVYGTGDDGGLTITRTQSGNTVERTKTKWEDFTNTVPGGEESPIKDWGLKDIDGAALDSSTKSFDDAAVYNYTNKADTDFELSFDFKLSDEAGLEEVKKGIDGLNINQSIYSPNTFRASVAAGSGASLSVSLSTGSLSYVTQKAYGRNFDDPNAEMSGTVTRTFHADNTVQSSSYTSTSAKSGDPRSDHTGTNNSDVYLSYKDENGDTLYLRAKKQVDTYIETQDGTRTRTDRHRGSYTFSDPVFNNINLNDINIQTNFNYYQDYTEDMQRTRTVTYTSYSIYSSEYDSPVDWDWLNENGHLGDVVSGPAMSSKPEQSYIWADPINPSAWSGWSKKSPDAETAVGDIYKTAHLNTNIGLTSSNGNLGSMQITDNGRSIGDSTLKFDFRSTGTAYAMFYSDEKSFSAGNKNDHVEMRDFKVNVPPKELPIQTSAQNPDYIPLRWSGLNNAIIGIKGTNTATIQEARYAIDEIGAAIKMVSDTRSTFGAQQNRLEHAVKQNNNTAENTQAAETRIRDTDMADEMVRYSKETILQQAGQAMLTQANHQKEGVLTLLR